MSSDVVSGSCLCKAVQYEADLPTLFCAHCHCHFCRRAHSAAFVTWIGVRKDVFRLNTGEDRIRWFNSSQQSRRAFCEVCGTTLFFASDLCPGEVHIALATVDTVIDREPQAHVFYDQHVDWVSPGDELPKLSSDNKQLEKYKSITS